MTKHKDILELTFYYFIALLFIALATYFALTIPNTKPEPKYKNTLQRDINP